MRIGSKISWLVIGTALAATVTLTCLGYASARRQYITGIDHQLTTAAAALPRVIGSDYLRRAMNGTGIPEVEYARLVQDLSDLADRAGVYYVYVFAQDGERIVHLATSASVAERAADDWPAFRDPYDEPPASLFSTFADGATRFDEYTDEFGSFRSIFVRHTGDDDAPYIVGVDVSLDRIHRDLSAVVGRYLAAGALVALLAAGAGVLIARRIARPILELSREVDAWSRRDFARDDAIRGHLERLARRHRDETGELATRFVDVQDRLQVYLQELARTTAAKQKIEHQLEIAKSIQEGLLPREAPRIANFEITGWCQPADQTGGDYFDWITLPNGHLMLSIGDVTGHGIGPALVTAASRAYARATFNTDQALDAAISRLNDLLHGDLRGERFVTLVACLLDPEARHLKLVAAGHGPIMFYCRRRDQIDVTNSTQGLPLGIVDNGAYDQPIELSFEPGDVLALVSDGFFEWQNPGEESFGTRRLVESILASCRDAPDQIIDRLRRDIAGFTNGTRQADDTTALVIRCVG